MQASLTAEEILNSWPAAEVGKVLREYGEESNWQFLQNQIVEARAKGGLHTTDELVHLVRRASSNSGGRFSNDQTLVFSLTQRCNFFVIGCSQ